MITAASLRTQPIHTGYELDQPQLGDLVRQAADLGLFKFNLAPRLGVALGHRLDDLLNLAAGDDAFLLQL